jgi:hypothetical protein
MVSGAQQKSEGLTIPRFVIGDVKDVAKAGYKACIRGEVICVPGVVNQITTLSSKTAPRWLLRRVGGILGRYTTKKH